MATNSDSTAEQRALLASAQAGDERAFRLLVEPYRRPLEVHCYRMLGSPHDAEDVLQETLLRAWKALERFERRSSVQTWLYRIATNACLDEIERRPRRPEPMVEPYPDDRLAEIGPAIADPAARYARREGMQLAFLTAIQRLPGRQRAVLVLRDVLGWTSPEVAELLDSTVASTNSALQRARATIDDVLPSQIPEPAPGAERDLLHRYLAAWEAEDMDALVALLREDAVLRMPPEASIHGGARIIGFFGDNPCTTGFPRATPMWANGRPALGLRIHEEDGTSRPHRLLVLDVDETGRVAVLHAHGDPATMALFGV